MFDVEEKAWQKKKDWETERRGVEGAGSFEGGRLSGKGMVQGSKE